MKDTFLIKRIAFWLVLEVGYWLMIGILFILFILFVWGLDKLMMLSW